MESHKIPWFQSTNQRRSEVVDPFWAQKNTPCPPPDWCQSSHRFRWTSDHPPTELCGRRPPKRWTMEYFHRASKPRCHDWQTRHGLMFKWVGNIWNDSVERADLSNYQMFIEEKKGGNIKSFDIFDIDIYIYFHHPCSPCWNRWSFWSHWLAIRPWQFHYWIGTDLMKSADIVKRATIQQEKNWTPSLDWFKGTSTGNNVFFPMKYGWFLQIFP